MKPSIKNKVIIACAGGRKTTHLVEEALKIVDEPVLITTYTLENLDQIYSYIVERKGFVPSNIKLDSWYTFLLHDFIRPYQNNVFPNIEKVETLDFNSTPPRGLRKDDSRYYFNRSSGIYRDRVSDYAYRCNEVTTGLVIKRLEQVYKHIFIDEAQDLAGWDLNLAKLLFNSNIDTFMVADPRQATYSTNRSNKNKGKRGQNFPEWVDEQVKCLACTREDICSSHRSVQQICDFSDLLYPEYPQTTSQNKDISEHDGVFVISNDLLDEYIGTYNPVCLRFSKRTNTYGCKAINIGVSKGRTYRRVIVFPTQPMKDFLCTGDITKAGDRSKFYVAVTRARQSVAFVINSANISNVRTSLVSEYTTP